MERVEGKHIEWTIKEYLHNRPDGKFCSRCGRVSKVHKECVASVCNHCCIVLSELSRRGYYKERNKESK
jgi:hypothetical protein